MTHCMHHVALARRRLAALALLCAFMLVREAGAHAGPPYMIMPEAELRGRTVSVWADPDVGVSRFFVIFEGGDGPTKALDARIEVWIEPVDGRLPRTTYVAKRDTSTRQLQYLAQPVFDRQDIFRVGVVITPAEGDAMELLTEVEATPDGLQPWYMAVYGFPFLLLIGFWIVAMRRRWRMTRDAGPAASGDVKLEA